MPRNLKHLGMIGLLGVCSFFFSSCVPDPGGKKIGVIMFGGGLPEDYQLDWKYGYQQHLYPYFPYGFYAGGPIDGGDCYTLIHYADEAEAAICNVALETPVDIFCNEYLGTDVYPVHIYVYVPGTYLYNYGQVGWRQPSEMMIKARS